MAFEFKLPDIGEGVVEGEIVKWLVKPGDRIDVDQPMVEVMTDKATVVIPSPRAGVVVETRGKEGEIAKVHAVLVVIDEQGKAAPEAAKQPAQPAPKQQPAKPAQQPAQPKAAAGASAGQAPQARAQAPQRAPARAPAQTAQQTRPAASAPSAPARPKAHAGNGSAAKADSEPREPGGKVLAAPATRRLARELGIDLAQLQGSGPAGRITSEDVKRAAESGGAPEAHEEETFEGHAEARDDGQRAPAQAPARPHQAPLTSADERVPVRGLRRRIWDNMVQSSFTAAHFTFVEECDATELVKVRERFNAKVKGEENITFLPFIVKAVIASLRKFRDLNAHVDDDNMEFIRRAEYHIGIAVASERGLIVPVVRHADRRSLLDLSREIKRLADATRAAKLQPSDLGGSTFTITSLGKEGGIFATPIINYPEVAIMGVHKLAKRPVVRDDKIVIREMMNLSLSFDHRLIDGHVGAAFTYAVIRLLEDPERLMMEMG